MRNNRPTDFEEERWKTSRLIQDWQPESPEFWQNGGRKTARRNLWVSVLAPTLVFAVWQVWSAVVIRLPRIGSNYPPDQFPWLVVVFALSEATSRAFHLFMVLVSGGRRWTVLSTASLLLLTVSLGMAIQSPDISYGTMLLLALLCGLGGVDLSPGMASISFSFPKAEKGTVMGPNAGLGNLGVLVAQFVVLLVIIVGLFGVLGGGTQTWMEGGASKQIWLQNASLAQVLFITAPPLAAWFDMNDLASAKIGLTEQAVVLKRKHNWVVRFIYLGMLDLFLGFSAGFLLLIQTAFPAVNPVKYVFLGPLIGTLTRPFSGWVADKTGSDAKTTQWAFTSMIAVVFGMLSPLSFETQSGSFWGFPACFMILFALSGIGSGSTFMQIPMILLILHQRRVEQESSDGRQALADAAEEGAVVAGFTSALMTYGDFFIPRSHGTSVVLTGSVNGAPYGFILFYLCCLLLSW